VFAATPVHSGERLSVVAFQQIDDLAARAKSVLDKNRQILNEFLDTREDLETVRTPFGTVAFPRLRKSADELCGLLQEKYETSVVPGRFFEMPDHFRIGIAGDRDALEQGLNRLGDALNDLRSQISDLR